jgi:hypothetical protein
MYKEKQQISVASSDDDTMYLNFFEEQLSLIFFKLYNRWQSSKLHLHSDLKKVVKALKLIK